MDVGTVFIIIVVVLILLACIIGGWSLIIIGRSLWELLLIFGGRIERERDANEKYYKEKNKEFE